MYIKPLALVYINASRDEINSQDLDGNLSHNLYTSGVIALPLSPWVQGGGELGIMYITRTKLKSGNMFSIKRYLWF